ncbi:MAG: hypothetical protein AMJ46_05100 [Latescibacteria bacterium DG_63]|nr:MAG: hypothetical protein AMJ46_05100 [Latescibacteria bacterium DG_63]
MPKYYAEAVLRARTISTALFALAFVLAFGFAGVASAQLTDTFELDGNAITDNASPGLPDDWDRLYYDSGHSAVLWTGVIDDYGAEETTRFSGSKDIHEIEEWKWDSNPITPKNEIENAYAALYDNGHFVFGSDRYRTSGSAQMGFWLLQGDVGLNPDGTFYGSHVDGDALILSHFSSGGRVSDIELYVWDTSRPAGDRLVQVTPLDSTVVYAYVSDLVSSSPWPYEPDNGNANEFQVMSFFEGAADLTELGITGCFTNFLAETRTSFSLDAELKDFVLGEFPATPSVTVNSEEVCEGESAQLCAEVTGGIAPYSFSWSTGSTDSCITVTEDGTYTVVVTGANGCASGPAAGTLTVHPLPTCSITGDNDICFGETTDFCGPGGMSVYSWTGPGGFSASTQCTGPIGTAGTYVVTITDANGCQNTCDRTLTVYDLPTCEITGTNNICIGATTDFCGPGGMSVYSWTGPGGFSASTQCTGPIGTAGLYVLTITDANGCQSTCDRTLTLYDLPVCSITRTGGDADTVCPCFPENPDATHEYCGPDVADYSYAWSVGHGADIISDTDIRCIEVKPIAHCDTFFTLTVTVTDPHGCQSTCYDTAYVVDNTPPVVDWCPPDTVIECHDLGDVWPLSPGFDAGGLGAPSASDDCDPSPWVSHADKGDRPTNWQRGVDDWGSCGEDTTVLRTWYVTDFCGNVDSSCVQAIAIQDTIPPRLACPPDTVIPCESPVVFGEPAAKDSCDPDWLVEIIIETTGVVPGPGPGEFTHTRCWTATDSCGNPAPVCCQQIIVQACPDKYCTYTMGGWGSTCPDPQQGDSLSVQPGCVRDFYFSRVFPTGVLIGDPAGLDGGPLYAARWTSALAVENFLPAGTTPKALEQDYTNPDTEDASVLAGQILALHMNVGYSCEPTVYDDRGFLEPLGCYADFVVPDSCGVSSGSVFAGMKVDSFLAIADSAVAGDEGVLSAYGVTLSDINFTATCLNEAFDKCDPFSSAEFQIPRPYRLDGEVDSEIEESPDASPIPERFAVGQSYPNPFNPSATISFALPSDGRVLIEVYDIVGRKVITLLDGHRQAGYHNVVWYGKDIQGRPVASGVYFCRVQFGDETDVQKMILLK